jgi:hypothetical protein
MMVVVVNAGTQGAIKIDDQQREPTLPAVLGGVVGAPMDNYSFDSIQLLLSQFTEFRRLGAATTYYPVLISFPLIQDKDLRNTVNDIGTSFDALTAAQLDGLKKAADLLLHQDPCFQRFMHDDNPAKNVMPPPDVICGSVPPPR